VDRSNIFSCPLYWRHVALAELAYPLMKSLPGDLIEEGRI
jgi:hypothetical protein